MVKALERTVISTYYYVESEITVLTETKKE